MRGWIKEWRKNLNYQRFYISNDSRMHDAQLTEASGSCHWNIFLSSSCSMWWKMFPQVEVWRLDSRVTRVISNRIFPPVKCWMPRVTTGTVTVTISNLQNTRFHRYSPPIQSNCIFPPYKCWLPALHGHRCYNHQFTKCLSFIPSTDLGRIWFQNDRHTRNLIKGRSHEKKNGKKRGHCPLVGGGGQPQFLF